MLLALFLTYLPSWLVLPAAAIPPSQSNHATEFPWIRKFASIGDSYAAGLGAGERVDFVCSRFDHSYPKLLETSYLGEHPERSHQFLACTGAKAKEILENQIPALGTDLDLLTMSAGGNDIGLTPILNDCIYQFYMSSESDCKTAIENAKQKIADRTGLYSTISGLINATIPKMNQTHGVLYMTGYASFFGIDDHTCDNVTWAVWRDIETEKQTLRLEMRQELNEMVRSVNDVLRQATDDAGPNVRFIDYNQYIKKGRGRYCEAGVLEPDPNRLGLAFYEWETLDKFENDSILTTTGDDVPVGSFEAEIAERINKTLSEHPDWEFDPDKGFVNKSKIRPDGIIEDVIWWMLPDTWKRVFHLRPEAHAIIAQLIVADLEAKRKEGKYTAVLLMKIAGVGLGIIASLVLLLVLFVKRRQSKSWQPVWWSRRSDEPLDESDDETLADPAENETPASKNYNTFI